MRYRICPRTLTRQEIKNYSPKYPKTGRPPDIHRHPRCLVSPCPCLGDARPQLISFSSFSQCVPLSVWMWGRPCYPLRSPNWSMGTKKRVGDSDKKCTSQFINNSSNKVLSRCWHVHTPYFHWFFLWYFIRMGEGQEWIWVDNIIRPWNFILFWPLVLWGPSHTRCCAIQMVLSHRQRMLVLGLFTNTCREQIPQRDCACASGYKTQFHCGVTSTQWWNEIFVVGWIELSWWGRFVW